MQLSIVSYLDDSATQEVRKLQQTMSEITGSRASLDSWQPHITLGDGIEVAELELDKVIKEMQRLAGSIHKFSLTISGFGYLDSRPIGTDEVSTPYVIFINVAVKDELARLVKRIGEVTEHYRAWYKMPHPYLPHITLAFRDLSESGYLNGMNFLSNKEVRIVSNIDHIALVQKLPNTDIEFMRISLT